MKKFITLLFLVFSLIFVVNCGSRSVPKGLNDQELYETALEMMNEDKGGFPWIFGGRDNETILKILKEVQLRYTYSPYATLAELRTRDRERKLISKIQKAIQKTEDGSYGTCEVCGDEITQDRLMVRPETTLCIDCKEEQEIEEKQFGL